MLIQEIPFCLINKLASLACLPILAWPANGSLSKRPTRFYTSPVGFATSSAHALSTAESCIS